MAAYFADTSFWMALSRKRDQYNRHAIAWNQFVIRTKSSIVTTEAVLWEWLNGLSDASPRGVAAEGYRRAHADSRIEVVPFQPELIDSAVQLYRTRPDKDWSLIWTVTGLVQRGGARALLRTTIGFPARGRHECL